MDVVKLRERGGNLVVTIPRRIWRELGWTERMFVAVQRTEEGALTVVNLERHLADTKRLRANPVAAHPGTQSPTARENRP
jgi:hypothetical protein